MTNLEKTFQSLLARRESRSQLRRLTTVAPGMVDFSSNSYLSLASNPHLQRAYLELMQSRIQDASASSSSILGSGGSRLLDGNSSFAESLERDIAAFHVAPAGLLFNSGFDANVGLFSCVPQSGDVIVYDELIHASVHDGMRQSRAAVRLPFRHNTVVSDAGQTTQDLNGLDAILQDLKTGESGNDIFEGKRNVFVAVEGVYSMDGDVAPLREIVDCVKRQLPRGNGYIIVDEAHSTAIFGHQGRGLVCELGLEDSIFARVHTFGKAMSCSGGRLISLSLSKTNS
jgi:8-amino-7-oxononanoate synthase